MTFCVLLLLLLGVIHCNGGFKVVQPDTLGSSELTYQNNSAIITLNNPNSTLFCPGGERPVTISETPNATCPKYLVGINEDYPQCPLDVKGKTCLGGDLEVSGSILAGCDLTYRVCQVPFTVVVPLQSVISPSVDQVDYLLSSNDLQSGARFGQSVDVNSSFIISGAPLGSTPTWPGIVTGAAYIFQSYIAFVNTSFSSVQWVQTQVLSPFANQVQGEVEDSEFGTSVKLLCGVDNALQFAGVGAPTADVGGTSRGVVYIFRNTGNTINVGSNIFPLVDPLERIASPIPRNNAFFGQTVEFALFRDGSRQLFIGAPGDRDNNNQNDAGSVYWFTWNSGTSSWDNGGKLSCIFTGPASSLAGAHCGTSITFAQDPSGLALMAVGAPDYQRNGGAAGAGSLSLFQWNVGLNTWVAAGGFIPDVGDSYYGLNFHFAYALAFSGNAQWLFVGTPGATVNSTTSVGVAVVYEQAFINSTTYSLYRSPITLPVMLEAGGSPDEFGFSLVSNWESDKVVICAPGFGLVTVPNSGLCFRFDYTALSGSWNETFEIIGGSDSQSGSIFGYSVATDLSLVVIGSPGYQVGAIDNGIASINYDLQRLTYVRNTTCIEERGVLLNIVTLSCQFALLKNIPPGFYKVTTNTSALGLPSNLITTVFYQFSEWGTEYLDAYFTIKYYTPTIPQEDEFYFYFLSRTHTSANINLLAKIVLDLPTP